jgi:hypothetical protein
MDPFAAQKSEGHEMDGGDDRWVLLCVAVGQLLTGPIPSSSSLWPEMGGEYQRIGLGLSKDPVAAQRSEE